jgi:hypothetical protein
MFTRRSGKFSMAFGETWPPILFSLAQAGQIRHFARGIIR